MKNDILYLSNILECINKIESYTVEGKNVFFSNPMIQDAVIRNFEIIGEATKRLSKELKDNNPEIKWRQIAGFRDILIHDYMSINLNRVWLVVEDDLTVLKTKIKFLLSHN